MRDTRPLRALGDLRLFQGGDAAPHEIAALADVVRQKFPVLHTGWYSGRAWLPEGLRPQSFDYISWEAGSRSWGR